eukprot:UN03064
MPTENDGQIIIIDRTANTPNDHIENTSKLTEDNALYLVYVAAALLIICLCLCVFLCVQRKNKGKGRTNLMITKSSTIYAKKTGHKYPQIELNSLNNMRLNGKEVVDDISVISQNEESVVHIIVTKREINDDDDQLEGTQNNNGVQTRASSNNIFDDEFIVQEDEYDQHNTVGK